MSRLSARPANTNAERRARLETLRAFQQQQMLSSQEADEQERQMIMQANLAAMANGQQQYLAQQNARKAGRAAMAQDREIRRRNRLDGIKAGNAQQHAALMEQRRQQELAEDQAALTAERDAQLHGYGMEDATQQHGFNQQLAGQQHGFNQDMANLTNRHTMGRDRRLHGFNQQTAAQQQAYGMQNAEAAHGRSLETAHLNNRFSQEAAHLQHGQALERAGVAHGMDMERDQFGFQLDQLGANAQQFRGQQDAVAAQGRNREDLSFANKLQQGNALDERIARLKEEGWTLNPSMQAVSDQLDNEEKILLETLTNYGITSEDAAAQLEGIKNRRRQLVPTERPAVVDPKKEFERRTYTDKDNVKYAIPLDGPPTVLRDPNQRSGSSRGQEGAFDVDGNLTFEADQKVRADVEKSYLEYKRNEMMMAADGTTPSIQSKADWLREQIPFMNPNVQQIYAGILEKMDAEKPRQKPGGKTPGFMNLGVSPPPQASQSPQGVNDWQQAGSSLLSEGQFYAGPNAKVRELDDHIGNITQDPTISRALQGFPDRAQPLVDQLGGALRRYKAFRAKNEDPNLKEPGLLDLIVELRGKLRTLGGTGAPPTGLQQYADPHGEF